MSDPAQNLPATPPESELPAPVPRRRSAVGISMGVGLLLGFIIGVSFSRLFALTMFFGAALGAGVGAVIDARRRDAERS